MVEKKTKFISVRVPASWKRRFQERGIEASQICRSALFQALQQSDLVLNAGSKLRSKKVAAALWNGLRETVVRTIPAEFEPELSKKIVKIPYFRKLLLSNESLSPNELVVLGDFLSQGEYAEEILSEVYNSCQREIQDEGN
jgi:hypothetical protein